MPSRREIQERVNSFQPELPDCDRLCVSVVYKEKFLYDFGLTRGRHMSGHGVEQLLIWLQSSGEDYPRAPRIPGVVEPFDMSGLWENPKPYGVPQGLFFPLGQRVWDLRQRPFLLTDVDIYVDDVFADAMAAAQGGLGLTCGTKKYNSKRLSGVNYISDDPHKVTTAMLDVISSHDKNRHWEEKLLRKLTDRGDAWNHNVPFVNVNWKAQKDNPEFSWEKIRVQALEERKKREENRMADIRPALETLKETPKLVGAEVGVCRGNHVVAILEELDIKFLYLVDHYPVYELPGGGVMDRETQDGHKKKMLSALSKEAYSGRWAWMNLCSEEAADCIEDKTLDFAYIDDDHREPAVRASIAAWWPKVKPGGLLCGHDFANTGAGKGVKPAVRDFAAEKELELNTARRDWWVRKGIDVR